MKTSLVLRVFVPFALGYCVASILRSINAVIAPQLVRDLGLSAAELGFSTSAFFFAAVLMQLPYGMLLDRYDPRKLYAVFLLLCALGAFLTAAADGLFLLTLGRGLIALGGAASAVTSYKIYAMWYPPDRLPLANGMSLAAGGLGVLIGTTPVELALAIMDWRDIHRVVGALLLISVVAVLTVAPKKTTPGHPLPFLQQVAGFGIIFRSLVFWRAAPLTFVVLGTFGGVGTLWIGPWVRDVAELTGTAATNVLLLLSVAFTASGMMVGWMTGLTKRAGLSLMGFVAGAAILFLGVLLALFLQPTGSFQILLVWSLFGFLGPLNMVSFAALSSAFPVEMTGRLNACLSLFWLGGGFVIQNLYAWVIDWFPSTGGSYAVEGHKFAMGLLVMLLITALCWFVLATLLLKYKAQQLPGNDAP